MKEKKLYTISIVLCIIDQLVKLIVINNLKVYQKISVIPHFFQIYYVQNRGAAFSSFSGMTYLFILVGAFFVFLLIRFIRKSEHLKKLEGISLGLLLGGIVGNLIDRILYHYVIDYLSFEIVGYSFAVFNVADSAIVIGCLLLIIECFRGEERWKNLNIKEN